MILTVVSKGAISCNVSLEYPDRGSAIELSTEDSVSVLNDFFSSYCLSLLWKSRTQAQSSGLPS